MTDARFRSFTPATIRSYESNLRRFRAFLEARGVPLERAGSNELKAFLAFLQGQGFVEETILNNFSSLSSFYDHLLMEGHVLQNPVLPFRKRYLRKIAQDRESHRSHPRRQVPDVEALRRVVLAGRGARDRAIILLFLKTGLRREELSELDVDDVDLGRMVIRVHPHRKRANTKGFFDAECRHALLEWLEVRSRRKAKDSKALFLNAGGERLRRSGIYNAVVRAATRAGVHDPESRDPERRFTPHHGRHFFTSVLLNNGVSRQFVQWLRGDHARDAVDQYFHVNEKELQQRYLAAMPNLGVFRDR